MKPSFSDLQHHVRDDVRDSVLGSSLACSAHESHIVHSNRLAAPSRSAISRNLEPFPGGPLKHWRNPGRDVPNN
jgi:hypothetical protein